jgi:hypothetical protein
MRISTSAKCALGVIAIVATVAGCSSGGSQLAPSGPMQQRTVRLGLSLQAMGHLSGTLVAKYSTVTAKPDLGKSWMKPNSGALLYVSDSGTYDVYVYSYPAGVRVGKLTGFTEPQGLCVDKTGNVWVSNTGASNMLEYAHGGKSPINTLSDPGQDPVGCTVDAAGNLDVTNILTTTDGPGSLSIYTSASGSPTNYAAPFPIERMYFIGSHKTTLYIDGIDPNGVFQFTKFATGTHKFHPITVSGATIHFPGAVQFADMSLALSDQIGSAGNSVTYQITGKGVVTGTTQLASSSDAVQAWIQGTTEIAPNDGGPNVNFYAYPAGGSPTKTISGFSLPIGATVSK